MTSARHGRSAGGAGHRFLRAGGIVGGGAAVLALLALSTWSLAMLALATFVGLVGGWYIRRGHHRGETWAKLARDGVLAHAIVGGVRKFHENRTRFRVWGWIVEYRYADRLGGDPLGESCLLPDEEATT